MIDPDAPAYNSACVDLDKYKKDALSRRELAWELLKQTRNADYVALRYGYPLEQMRAALEKIPNERTTFQKLQQQRSDNSAGREDSTVKRASELLPETVPRSRVPGEDDEPF